ncbi:MAG: response regulator [Chloroflexota bacterium]
MSLSDQETPIRVEIVDDYPGVRAGLRNLLRNAQDMIVIAEAANGTEAIELARTQQPDIILLDIELPDIRGEIVMLRIQKNYPAIKVLAVSSYTDREYIQIMVQNGAAGYITKDETPALLLEAIRSIVYDGRNWLSPRAIKNSSAVPIEEQMLTKREKDILNELVKGIPEEDVAEFLGMEEAKLQRYINLMMMKFEAETVEALKLIARRILPGQETDM